MSLLNTNLKFILKELATRLKGILPDLISFKQTAYVKNRYISASGTASILNKKGFLVTVDIENVFDSVEEHLLKWIQILIKNQISCVENDGITTKFFSLDREAR